MGLNVFKW